jgi:putative heme-binding domain-containing protein
LAIDPSDRSVDLEAWQRRLGSIDWSTGDEKRGQSVFAAAACAGCHSRAGALGPDLRGVAARFSRDDLFTAILIPDRDVSDRYQTTLIVTDDGETRRGIPIYEAVDGVILQTSPERTVRIEQRRIAVRQTTRRSLMPQGLLDQLSGRELADLYAYLKSL